jgi:hypothetical protein
MSPDEQEIQSFTIKVRLSELNREEAEVLWYGYITHVPSGKRHYFRQLGEVAEIIQPYLEKMGITFVDNIACGGS